MTLDFEIIEKKYNAPLARTEIQFKFVHAKEATPKRDLARDKVAEIVNAKKETIIVDNMKSDFGRGVTRGYAKVYKSKAEAQACERDYLLKRNHIFNEKKKKTEQPKKKE